MPFIGNKPSAVPLTSADITDGIIVNADISSTAGITLNKISGNPNFRNIVINGDMQVAQRSTSVASITTDGYYTVDRFIFQINSLGTWTQSQSTDTPTGQGFGKSFKLDCTTADATPSASDYMILAQKFEGQNLQYLKKGTANALPLTASFWVKSTKTGTFICELVDEDNVRSISKSYTVSVSNTWEFKTVTFPGDTTGVLDNDNSSSLKLNFWLGAGTDFTSGTLATTWGARTNANIAVGQVNIADSTSNDFLITGVQLEAGTSASDFEFLPYDVDLARCQRYYVRFNAIKTYSLYGIGNAFTTGIVRSNISLPVTMRIGANGYDFSAVSGFFLENSNSSSITPTAVASNGNESLDNVQLSFTVTGATLGAVYTLYSNNNTTSYIGVSAEL